MKHIEYLIIGQGMAGTFLSAELILGGSSILVVDKKDKHNTSLVASAVINPLIAKKWTIVNEVENNIEIALESYNNLSHLLGIQIVHKKSLIVFHNNQVAANSFNQQDDNPFIVVPDFNQFSNFEAPFGIGSVSPVYTIDAKVLLSNWTNYLVLKDAYLPQQFLYEDLIFTNKGILYKDFIADNIVFCEGAAAGQNPYFPALPFTKNRGDVLLISIPDLSPEYIYHKDIRLVPLRDNLFWCGSNYIWDYDSLAPNVYWRRQVEKELSTWLKLPFKTIDHLVAERPTTAGQQALLQQSEQFKNVYLFNGLGTRGFSVGPFLAKKMCRLMQKKQAAK